MRPDEYRPDPPAGLAWSDFLAARGRYRSRLAAASEIARLERAFAFRPDDEPPVGGAPETRGPPSRPPGARAF
jgi:hypothetical protein